jgi:hypothetical protein
MSEITKEVLIKLSRKLADEGKLIEAGWIGLRITMDRDAPQVQLDEMRYAFISGAQHLFASIMNILDLDREPTAADLRRMSLIHTELQSFESEIKRRARGWEQ